MWCAIFVFSCASNEREVGDSKISISVQDIDVGVDNFAKTGHRKEFSYQISTDKNLNNVGVSFYLAKVSDQYDNFTAFEWGSDLIEELMVGDTLRTRSLWFPAIDEDGEYFIIVHLDEFEEKNIADSRVFTSLYDTDNSSVRSNNVILNITTAYENEMVAEELIIDDKVIILDESDIEFDSSSVDLTKEYPAHGRHHIKDAQLQFEGKIPSDDELSSMNISLQIQLNDGWNDIYIWNNFDKNTF